MLLPVLGHMAGTIVLSSISVIALSSSSLLHHFSCNSSGAGNTSWSRAGRESCVGVTQFVPLRFPFALLGV
ncbi:hypothetical protein F4821DRAFT_227665 [Hypoxylon rubiginosum]|uniref:Uncharacterized protein n=1 Tax=Hypoxylon rubiginosum TaxID=110542 RepID=A0ACC0DEG9_9PEZI|nr:hypothetical protein F4821DRAFT_227665 [Hypoxylon rubiginosum]